MKLLCTFLGRKDNTKASVKRTMAEMNIDFGFEDSLTNEDKAADEAMMVSNGDLGASMMRNGSLGGHNSKINKREVVADRRPPQCPLHR